ncbi:hypothetical protein C8Q75DRAFT_730581 [Abortiporus biennis]|nr:hypothetical protein C8Q75DRAFT_730581 [Abortiporus biennis]
MYYAIEPRAPFGFSEWLFVVTVDNQSEEEVSRTGEVKKMKRASHLATQPASGESSIMVLHLFLRPPLGPFLTAYSFARPCNACSSLSPFYPPRVANFSNEDFNVKELMVQVGNKIRNNGDDRRFRTSTGLVKFMYSDQRRNGKTGTANTMRLCRVHGSELLLPQASVIVDNLGLSRGHSYALACLKTKAQTPRGSGCIHVTCQVIVILVVRRHPRIHESYVSQTDSAGITNTKVIYHWYEDPQDLFRGEYLPRMTQGMLPEMLLAPVQVRNGLLILEEIKKIIPFGILREFRAITLSTQYSTFNAELFILAKRESDCGVVLARAVFLLRTLRRGIQVSELTTGRGLWLSKPSFTPRWDDHIPLATTVTLFGREKESNIIMLVFLTSILCDSGYVLGRAIGDNALTIASMGSYLRKPYVAPIKCGFYLNILAFEGRHSNGNSSLTVTVAIMGKAQHKSSQHYLHNLLELLTS